MTYLPTKVVRISILSSLWVLLSVFPVWATTLEEAKAHYIFEVIKHTTWPNDALRTDINIVVLGREPELVNAIDNKAQTAQIRNKRFSVQNVNVLNEPSSTFNIIFITRVKRGAVKQVNSLYPNALVITDGPVDRNNQQVSLVGQPSDLEIRLNRENLVARGFNVSDNLVAFAGTREDFTGQLRDKSQDLQVMRSTMAERENQLAILNEVLEQNTASLQQAELQLGEREQQLREAEQRLLILQQDIEIASVEIQDNRISIDRQKQIMAEKQSELESNQRLLDEQSRNMKSMQSSIASNQRILDDQLKQIEQQESDIEAKDTQIDKQRTQLTINWIVLAGVLVMASIFLYLNLLRKRANKKLKELNSQLYAMATTDSMTLLFNRHHFIETTEKALKHQQRRDSNAVMLMLDIDHFKQVNDNYGHAMGDKAIMEVANVFKQSLRLYDIVGRLGGEEYGMMLLDCDIHVAKQIAERLRHSIEALDIECHGEIINITISIGLSKIRSTDETIDQVLIRADKGLYSAKEAGRNRVHVYDVEL